MVSPLQPVIGPSSRYRREPESALPVANARCGPESPWVAGGCPCGGCSGPSPSAGWAESPGASRPEARTIAGPSIRAARRRQRVRSDRAPRRASDGRTGYRSSRSAAAAGTAAPTRGHLGHGEVTRLVLAHHRSHAPVARVLHRPVRHVTTALAVRPEAVREWSHRPSLEVKHDPRVGPVVRASVIVPPAIGDPLGISAAGARCRDVVVAAAPPAEGRPDPEPRKVARLAPQGPCEPAARATNPPGVTVLGRPLLFDGRPAPAPPPRLRLGPGAPDQGRRGHNRCSFPVLRLDHRYVRVAAGSHFVDPARPGRGPRRPRPRWRTLRASAVRSRCGGKVPLLASHR